MNRMSYYWPHALVLSSLSIILTWISYLLLAPAPENEFTDSNVFTTPGNGGSEDMEFTWKADRLEGQKIHFQPNQDFLKQPETEVKLAERPFDPLFNNPLERD